MTTGVLVTGFGQREALSPGLIVGCLTAGLMLIAILGFLAIRWRRRVLKNRAILRGKQKASDSPSRPNTRGSGDPTTESQMRDENREESTVGIEQSTSDVVVPESSASEWPADSKSLTPPETMTGPEKMAMLGLGDRPPPAYRES
jgi:hypothetical protein